jgi:hypothetical protein
LGGALQFRLNGKPDGILFCQATLLCKLRDEFGRCIVPDVKWNGSLRDIEISFINI